LIGALALSAGLSAEASASSRQVGTASWYGPGFHGKKTASGERFNQHRLTAAHPRLPLGSRARVINLKNGKAVEVRINDRGPYHGGRIIDLSRAAAQRLAMGGIARVRVETMP
jgi:rare lipoprotein A